MAKNAALVGCALSVALALIVALVAPVPALALPALPVPGAAGGHPGAYMAVQGSNAGAENSHLRIRVFWGPPTLLRRAGDARTDASPRAYVYVCTSVLVLIDEHIARIVDGQPQTYVTDPLGTVRGVLDQYGNESRFSYTAFGKLRSQAGTRDGPYAFAGRALDRSGDYHFRARAYSPELGRFLAVDRYAPRQDTYAYARGNPLRFLDPLGLFEYQFEFSGFDGKPGWDSDRLARIKETLARVAKDVESRSRADELVKPLIVDFLKGQKGRPKDEGVRMHGELDFRFYKDSRTVKVLIEADIKKRWRELAKSEPPDPLTGFVISEENIGKTEQTIHIPGIGESGEPVTDSEGKRSMVHELSHIKTLPHSCSDSNAIGA